MLEGSKQKARGRGQYLAAFCFLLGLGGLFLLSVSAVQQAAHASPLPPAAPRGTASPAATNTPTNVVTDTPTPSAMIPPTSTPSPCAGAWSVVPSPNQETGDNPYLE
jgi:hypothetical protein